MTPTVKVNSESGTSVAELGVAQELGGEVWPSEPHEDPASVPRASATTHVTVKTLNRS